MKRAPFWLFIASLILLSCKKTSNSNNEDYISGMIDGKPFKYTKKISGIYYPGRDYLSLSASEDTVRYSPICQLIIYQHGTSITSREYIDTVGDYHMAILTSLMDKDNYPLNYAGGSVTYQQNSLHIENHSKITITSFSNDRVEGTFSGDTHMQHDHWKKISITDGKFSIPAALIR